MILIFFQAGLFSLVIGVIHLVAGLLYLFVNQHVMGARRAPLLEALAVATGIGYAAYYARIMGLRTEHQA